MSLNRFGGIITGTINPLTDQKTATVEYLVVGGGGGGGTNKGGGAGAGGFATAANFPITYGNALTITVGAGGIGNGSSPYGQNGANSVFSTVIAIGGGCGANNVSTGAEPGGNGGSGGGTRSSTAYGSGTVGQGNNGGVGNGSYGGGGGGAGSRPLAGSYWPDGGTGACSTITGQRVFYAGGGGGPWVTAAGRGGAGGGGTGSGSNGVPGFAGESNTGGAGGGGTDSSTAGGPGGSGIVIIRYPQNCAAPASTTGSPQILYNNGYQIYIWTSSGSVTF